MDIKDVISKASELKSCTGPYNRTAAQCSYDGNLGVELIVPIAQGISGEQRIGNRCELETIRLKGTLSEATDSVFVRCVLLLQHTCDGLAPATTDVFDATPYAADSVTVMDNFNHRRQFKILWDKIFTMDSPADGMSQVQFDESFFLHHVKQRWEGPDGLQVEILKQGIYFYCFTSATSAEAFSPKLTMNARLTFRDF